MNRKGIEKANSRLIEIKNIQDSGERNNAFMELKARIGAAGCRSDMPVGERDAGHIRRIHLLSYYSARLRRC